MHGTERKRLEELERQRLEELERQRQELLAALLAAEKERCDAERWEGQRGGMKVGEGVDTRAGSWREGTPPLPGSFKRGGAQEKALDCQLVGS